MLTHLIESRYDSANLIREIILAVFTQVNFAPVIRYQIGWRGFKDISQHNFAWTMKIVGLDGVFGIYDLYEKTNCKSTNYIINYFPNPETEADLLDTYSPLAQAIAYSSDYYKKIRSNELNLEFISQFNIANLSISLIDKSIVLAIKTYDNIRVIAEKDIRIEQQTLYKKGDLLTDIPAYKIAQKLFDVIVKSFNFSLNQAPNLMLIGANKKNKKISITSYDSSQDRISEEFKSYSLKTIEINNDLSQKFQEQIAKNQNPNILDSKAPAKLMLLTGYLGSGKTTFLKNFIEYQRQRNNFTAIIQNEVGEVNIDSNLTGQEFRVTGLEDGCVCCSIIGQFKYAIQSILSQFAPDTIVIELSGVSNPYNLLSEIEELNELVLFDNLTCLVDAEYFIKNSSHLEDLIIQQIQVANLIVINKCDLVSGKQLKHVQEQVRSINSKAIVIASQYGNINPAIIYDMETIDIKSLSAFLSQKPSKIPYICEKISLPKIIDRKKVINIIKDKGNIFRGKGFFNEKNKDGEIKRILFQYVNNNYAFEEFEFMDNNQENLLICISAK